jgi:hypothetical protein
MRTVRSAQRRLARNSPADLQCDRGRRAIVNEELGVDLDEISRVIDEADVFIVRFGKIESRLLVDARSAPATPARIEVVPPVNSASERYRYLQQTRPGLPLPDQITASRGPAPST